MAFFLIGRGPDDDLRLLSTQPLESRQAAMAELSRLSADPSFSHWDAEVFVVDLDAGVPVLLVRPAAATVPTAEPCAVETGDADSWEADLPDIEAAPQASALAVAPIEEAVPDAIGTPFWEPPTVALIEPVGDAAIADAIVSEASEPVAAVLVTEADPLPDLEVELEPAASVPPEPLSDESDELRAAILRTTEHMAAEGIVAPESIRSAQGASETVAVEAAVPSAPQIETPASPSEGMPTPPVEPAAVEPVPADEPALGEPVREIATKEAPPVVEAAVVEEVAMIAEPVIEEAPPAPKPSGGFWPWNRSAETAETESGVAPEVAGVYDALEEPSGELPEPDVEAALRAPALASTSHFDDELAQASEALPRDPMSSFAPEPPPIVPVDTPSDESDFILDLDSVEVEAAKPAETVPDTPAAEMPAPVAPPAPSEPAPAADESLGVVPEQAAVPAAPEPQASQLEQPTPDLQTDAAPAAVSPLQDYTCDDCVYMDTCPNRDQRLPKDCGSFQWR